MPELPRWEAALAAHGASLDMGAGRASPRWQFRTPGGCTVTAAIGDGAAPGVAPLVITTPTPAPWARLVVTRRDPARGSSSLTSGDVRFDRAVYIAHDGEPHRGLFDAATRAAAVDLVMAGGEVAHGMLVLTSAPEADEPAATDAPDIAPAVALAALVALVDRLARTDPTRAESDIERIAETDPDPLVREQFTRWANTPLARSSRARRDLARAGQLEAARLQAMVRDRELEQALRTDALTRLIRHAPLERTAELEPAALWGLGVPDTVLIAAIRSQRYVPGIVSVALSVVPNLAGFTVTQPTHLALELLEAIRVSAATTPDVLAWLGRVVWAHESERVRMLAAEHLVTMADAAALEGLMREASPRDRAAELVPLVLERAVGLLEDPATPSGARLRLLVLIDGPLFASILRGELAVRLARTLGAARDPAALGLLVKLCADPAVELEAMRAIARLATEPRRLLDALGKRVHARLVVVAPDVARADSALMPLVRALHGDASSVDIATCHAFVAAFAAHGEPDDARALRRHLASDDEGLVVATLAAIGAIGDLRALGLVKPLMTGLFRDRDIKAAARAAHDAILARVGDTAGGLTVSDGEGGGLSLDEEPHGPS